MKGGGNVLYARFTLRLKRKALPLCPKCSHPQTGADLRQQPEFSNPQIFGLRRQSTDTWATKNWTSVNQKLDKCLLLSSKSHYRRRHNSNLSLAEGEAPYSITCSSPQFHLRMVLLRNSANKPQCRSRSA